MAESFRGGGSMKFDEVLPMGYNVWKGTTGFYWLAGAGILVQFSRLGACLPVHTLVTYCYNPKPALLSLSDALRPSNSRS